MDAIGDDCGAMNKPVFDSPRESRMNAAAGIVLTSWDTTSSPSRAAYARISVSDSVVHMPTPRLENAPHRTRTYNPLIKSQLLCQLS
jgi:hypothetical protein